MNSVGYVVRYEKGSFKSGYCILENKQVAVINRYFETEARINSLLDILSLIQIDETALPDEQLQFWTKIKQTEFQS